MNVNDTYGRWTVTEVKPGALKVLCRCECGTVKEVYRSSLHGKKSTSCGCYQRMRSVEANTTHNASRSLAYASWHSMMNRCFEKNHDQYERYGAAGITVCDRWRDFANFYADLGERPSETHTLDRVDSSKGYSPDNCRWATKKEQAANRRSNVLITWLGKEMCLAEFARVISTTRQRVSDWLRKGKSPEEIVEIVTLRPSVIGRHNKDLSVQEVKL